MGINNVLLICYLYLNKSSTSQIVKMCDIQRESVTFWTFHLRELLADSLNFSDVNIGGDQVVVENDEIKLGKRKYNRGGVVDGVWVVGGIERTPEKNVCWLKCRIDLQKPSKKSFLCMFYQVLLFTQIVLSLIYLRVKI
ncbi:hypothetical protein H311_00531 [Anncaliia algerae PRA109]|nr:hypothetical protein H311_00531 [Anncaliia algerae PRA109]